MFQKWIRILDPTTGVPGSPAALGGSWFKPPFEGVTVKPPAMPEVLDHALIKLSQAEIMSEEILSKFIII